MSAPTPRTRSADVIVLGAGAAGLAAAAQLAAHGVDVLVLEARGRVGGRIWSLRDPQAPLPIELGAEFVHGDAPQTLEIVRQAALPLCDVTKEHWARLHGFLARMPVYEDSNASALEHAARIVRARGDRSFLQALTEARVHEPARSRVLSYVEGFQAARAERISALALDTPDLGEEPLRRVVSGYDQVVQQLAARLPPNALALGTIVARVRRRRGHVGLDARRTDGSALPALHARRLVVSVPLAALKGDGARAPEPVFDPPLVEKQRALAHLEQGNVVKATLLFRDAFWCDRALVRARRREPLDKLAFLHAEGQPFPTWWTSHPLRAPLLTAWAGGSRADELSLLDERARLRVALSSLAKALGVRRALVEGHFVAWWHHDWRADPFARGAYSHALVHGSKAHGALARPVDDTLFFAGEATCAPPANGTVHGALASGRRAATQVLASMARERRPLRRSSGS